MKEAHLLYQKTVILITIAFLAGFGVSYVVFEEKESDVSARVTTAIFPDAGQSLNGVNFSSLPEIWDAVQEKYVAPEKVSLKKLNEYAIKGFVAGIGDPYTVFMTKDESKEFQENLDGELEGIGAQLEVKYGKLTVITPLKNSPAEKAGVKAGDIIEKIDGVLAEELTLQEAVRRIRGKSGTKVKLTLLRASAENPIEIEILRGSIEIESVTLTENIAPEIALIEINQFGDSTENELQAAIQKLLLKKPKGLVLDLRFNGGGYLDIALDILSEFLSGKVVGVKIKRRNPAENEVLYTSGTGRLHDLPVVILVNHGSASASEIVAGALQDYKRATIMGERTFGKGSVQEIEQLRDGSSLRITIAKWLTPLDQDIDEIGIKPDILVEVPENTEEGKDPQLEEAIRFLGQ